MAKLCGTYVRDKSDEWKENFFTKLGIVRRSKLERLWTEQRGYCCYCGCSTYLGNTAPPRYHLKQRATFEHIVPQTEGGTDSYLNTVMACLACNGARGSFVTAEEFYALRQKSNWRLLRSSVVPCPVQ